VAGLWPELALARQLRTRGHRITVLGDDSLRQEVQATGVSFVGYERAPNRPTKSKQHDPLRDWELDNPRDVLQACVTRIICGPALSVAQDLLALCERDAADVVVGGGFVLGAIIGAEKAGLPSVVLMPNVDFRPAPCRPGFGPGLAPLSGPEGEARDNEIWAFARAAFQAGQPFLDKARDELGLPRTRHPWDEYDRARRVLLLTSKHFEYPYSLPARTLFAGPVLDDPVWATDLNLNNDGSVEPLVLVTLGSAFQNQLDAYRRIVTALRDVEARAIVTLGNVFCVDELQPPDNVRIVESAPHGKILERASATVTHGGHGSVLKSLCFGVPLACLPLGRDQLENAARVEWHGAGLKLDSAADPSTIAHAIARVLNEREFVVSAKRLGAAIREEIADGIAVRELEAVAEGNYC
jgi:MGT family glycosyltransferase